MRVRELDGVIVVRVVAHLLGRVCRSVMHNEIGHVAIQRIALHDFIRLPRAPRNSGTETRERDRDRSDTERDQPPCPQLAHGPNSCWAAEPLPPPPLDDELPTLEGVAAEATPYSCCAGGALGAVGVVVVV